jgi:ABC-type sugar transport system ATPase subunit
MPQAASRSGAEVAHMSDELQISYAPAQIAALTRKFGQLAAVDQVPLTVNQGEIFGLIRPNGADKRVGCY